MPLITVTEGAPQSALPDGVYPVILVEIRGPKTVLAQRGAKAGQEIELLDWIFAVNDGQYDGEVIEASTSTASGPKSKMYSYLTALHNGVAPAVGTQFEARDLTGRQALATIRRNESGWPKIENLGAMPASMQATALAKATGAPVKPTGSPAPVAATTPQPLREAVAAGATSDGGEAQSVGDLPF